MSSGAREFKTIFLLEQKDVELPQHNRMYRDVDPERILGIAAKAMRIDLGDLRNSKRIPKILRDQRDILIYLLWESGRFANQEIGSLLGIGYSNVSRRIKEIRKRFESDRKLCDEYKKVSALIKV